MQHVCNACRIPQRSNKYLILLRQAHYIWVTAHQSASYYNLTKHFPIIRALTTRDWRNNCSSETLIAGLWGPEIAKFSVGQRRIVSVIIELAPFVCPFLSIPAANQWQLLRWLPQQQQRQQQLGRCTEGKVTILESYFGGVSVCK